jgi:hypothetical protein
MRIFRSSTGSFNQDDGRERAPSDGSVVLQAHADAAAAAVEAVPDAAKADVAAAALQAVPDAAKAEIAASALDAVPDAAKADVATAALQVVPDADRARAPCRSAERSLDPGSRPTKLGGSRRV